MVKGEMAINKGDGVKKEDKKSKDTRRDGNAFVAGDNVL